MRASKIRPNESARPLFIVGVALVAALLGYSIVHAASSGPRAATSAPNPQETISGTPVHEIPDGIPAIQVRPDLAGTSGPHFAEAEVQQYVAATPLPHAVVGAPTPQVASVQFLTMQQLDTQVPDVSLGLPLDYLLCLVTVSGSFQPETPPGYQTTAISHGEFLIFDAHSGNLFSVVLQ